MNRVEAYTELLLNAAAELKATGQEYFSANTTIKLSQLRDTMSEHEMREATELYDRIKDKTKS